MNILAKRLLTFFIGVPLVLFLVFFDFYNHIVFNFVVSLFSILGSLEFYNITSKNYKLFSKPLLLIFSCLLPVLTFICPLFSLSFDIVLWAFTFEIIILMGIEAITAKSFENSISKLTISSFIIFYCGYLVSFITKLTTLENSKFILGLFFILVFLCDSSAWLFGILFGKNNRGFIAASPNKSIVGFIGGIAGSVVFGCIYKTIFEDIFTGLYTKIILVSLFTSIAAIIGDLIESVIKRAVGAKDSGHLIPGRGGVLDSIDSIVIAAPIFYICIYFIYNFI